MAKVLIEVLFMLQNNESFGKRLLGLLGATIMGVKPAELLTVPLQGKNGEPGWEAYRDVFANVAIIKYREVRILQGRQQVLFYHPQALTQGLQEKPVIQLLESLGYPVTFDLNNQLDFLIKKIVQESVFPYEAGIFLGYPLKDVLGYRGHPALPFQKVKGWRYYGDIALSQKLYERYERAKEMYYYALEMEYQ